LSTPTISLSGEACLTFAYHMYGATINQLKVEGTGLSSNIDLWSESGNQGDQWNTAEITIDANVGGEIQY